MRIGFLTNDILTERPKNTSVRLAMQANNSKHSVWMFGVADLTFASNGKFYAVAHQAPPRTYRETAIYLKALQTNNAQSVDLTELDVLVLRNNPSQDAISRPWAQWLGITFGRVAQEHGVLVVNDPDGLSRATNKLYLESFPESVRPRAIVTRNVASIRAFAEAENAPIILKPLQGYGGQGVFIHYPDQNGNINQIVEAISRDGYVIAQEYLPAALDGDTRLFVMDGKPLKAKGRYAAFCRARAGDDIRNNVRVGGTIMPVDVTSTMLSLVETIRPKLVADGMFLVGIDIVGEKIIEINVFSPGGLGSAQQCQGVSFTESVIKALERKHARHISDTAQRPQV